MRKLGEYLTKAEIEELNEQSGDLPYFDELSPVIKHFTLNVPIGEMVLRKLFIVYAKYRRSGWAKCIVCVFEHENHQWTRVKYYSEGFSDLIEELSFAADKLLDTVKEINKAIRFMEEL